MKVKINKDIHGKEKDVEFIGYPITLRQMCVIFGIAIIGAIFS